MAGAVFFWSCLRIPVSPLSEIIIPSSPPERAFEAGVYLLYAVVFILGILGSMGLKRRLSKKRALALALVCAGLLDSLGQFLLFFQGAELSLPSTMVGVVLVGVGCSYLSVVFGSLFAPFNPSRVPLDIIISGAISEFLIFCIVAAGADLGLFALASPTIAAACWSTIEKQDYGIVEEDDTRKILKRSFRMAPWGIAVASFVLIFIWSISVRILSNGSARSFLPNDRMLSCAISFAIFLSMSLFLKFSMGKQRLSNRKYIYIFAALTLLYLGALCSLELIDGSFAFCKRLLVSVEHCLEISVVMVLIAEGCGRKCSEAPLVGLSILFVTSCPWLIAIDVLSQFDDLWIVLGSTPESEVAAVLSLATMLVLVVTIFAFQYRAEPRSNGARGKEARRLCEAAASDLGITDRELDVMYLAYRGYTVKNIASTLYISESTVKSHMKSIYSKLGIHSKQSLITLIDGRGEE